MEVTGDMELAAHTVQEWEDMWFGTMDSTPLALGNTSWFKALPQIWDDYVLDLISESISSPIKDLSRLPSFQDGLNQDLIAAYLDLISSFCSVSIQPVVYPEKNRKFSLQFSLSTDIEVFIPMYLDSVVGHWTFVRILARGDNVTIQYCEPQLLVQLKEWLSRNFNGIDLEYSCSDFLAKDYNSANRGLLMLMGIRRLAAGADLLVLSEAEAGLNTFHRQVLAGLLAKTLDPTSIHHAKYLAGASHHTLPKIPPCLVDEKTFLKYLMRSVRFLRSRTSVPTAATLLSLHRDTSNAEDSLILRFKKARFYQEWQSGQQKLRANGFGVMQAQVHMLELLSLTPKQLSSTLRKTSVWYDITQCAAPFLGDDSIIATAAVSGSTTQIERLTLAERQQLIPNIRTSFQKSSHACEMLKAATPLYHAIVNDRLPDHTIRIENPLVLETVAFMDAVSLGVTPRAHVLSRSTS